MSSISGRLNRSMIMPLPSQPSAAVLQQQFRCLDERMKLVELKVDEILSLVRELSMAICDEPEVSVCDSVREKPPVELVRKEKPVIEKPSKESVHEEATEKPIIEDTLSTVSEESVHKKAIRVETEKKVEQSIEKPATEDTLSTVSEESVHEEAAIHVEAEKKVEQSISLKAKLFEWKQQGRSVDGIGHGNLQFEKADEKIFIKLTNKQKTINYWMNAHSKFKIMEGREDAVMFHVYEGPGKKTLKILLSLCENASRAEALIRFFNENTGIAAS